MSSKILGYVLYYHSVGPVQIYVDKPVMCEFNLTNRTLLLGSNKVKIKDNWEFRSTSSWWPNKSIYIITGLKFNVKPGRAMILTESKLKSVKFKDKIYEF